MKLSEINIRDPYILVHNGKYYLYGSRLFTYSSEGQAGFDVYKSDDMENWSNPKEIVSKKDAFFNINDFWAPEVYFYNEKFYMFATFKGEDGKHRGTYVLVCDTPDGNFQLHSTEAITPTEMECLDGSLYIENGIPYMVFCHEWTQIKDGKMLAIEMTADLKSAIGKPFELFSASECENAIPFLKDNYITDGPFLYKENGILYMLWSSNGEGGYVQLLACNKSGTLRGKWEHGHKVLYTDGGHGMIFNDVNGVRKIVLHTPSTFTDPNPCIFDFKGKDEYDIVTHEKCECGDEQQ